MLGQPNTRPVAAQREAMLRVPPFPGVRSVPALVHGPADKPQDLEAIADALLTHRVGGSFWARQPALPAPGFLLLKPKDASQGADMLREGKSRDGEILLWFDNAAKVPPEVISISGPCDPWHMASAAGEIWADEGDEILLIARLLGVPCRAFGSAETPSAETLLTRHIAAHGYVDPFTGAPCSVLDIIALLGHWRRMIDANRPIAAAFGFGHWKQDTVAALLWNGEERAVPFASPSADALSALAPDAAIALWKARVPPAFLDACDARSGPIFEVEDGFIRSAGLGADCVPPLSIVVDPLGAHFDPSQPNALENILAHDEFDTATLERAGQLRALIVSTGISKYGFGNAAISRPGGERRHILVPGQVEDDRSVLCGGGPVKGNLDLLRRARAAEPDAYIIYKPHPDVLSGHRVGNIPLGQVLEFADAQVTDQPIAALLDMVDGIHVMTSLAGFEALLRGKQVTTHGTPFYAGWGLTTDFAPVPGRRGRKRSIEELVAATLLVYPRYLDPLTGLPCPPEVMIARLLAGTKRENRALVAFRRAQGNIRRVLSRKGSIG